MSLLEELTGALIKDHEGKYALPPGVIETFVQEAKAITAGRELFEFLDGALGLAAVLANQKQSPAPADALFSMVAELSDDLAKLARAEAAQMETRSSEIRKRAAMERQALSPQLDPSAGPKSGAGGVGIRKQGTPR